MRGAKESKGLSIITVEGVDRLVITEPGGAFTSNDVRAAIEAVARAKTIAAKAFDLSGKDLSEVAIQRAESGWELKPPAGQCDWMLSRSNTRSIVVALCEGRIAVVALLFTCVTSFTCEKLKVKRRHSCCHKVFFRCLYHGV